MNPRMPVLPIDPGNPTPDDYSREVYFRRHIVQPPAMVYVTVDDIFVLKVFNPTAAATVNISIRYLTPQGDVIPQFQQFPNVAASSTIHTFNFRGSEGFVLSATISTPGAGAGACYVQLEVGRGLGAQDITEGALLIGGYPGSFAALGYPGTQPQPPSVGTGTVRSITVTTPAAGAQFSLTVPAGVTWILNSVRAQLVTSAVVANRTPDLQVKDASGNIVMDAVAGTSQTASATDAWVWGPGLFTSTTLRQSDSVGIPTGMRLNAGWVLQMNVFNMDVGDQWSQIVFGVSELVAS